MDMLLRRFCAYCIDILIIMVLVYPYDLFVVKHLPGIIQTPGYFLVPILYFSIMEASDLGASIGKRAVALTIVDDEGYGISFPKALIRNILKTISIYFWFLGYISVPLTSSNSAIHDLVTKTYVVLSDEDEYEEEDDDDDDE